MRYDINESDYITDVYFNCYSGTCVEYTGDIPDGYDSLEEWSENANINAYKIVEGNLVYDASRDDDLQNEFKKEGIENTPVLYKDLSETNIILDSQYLKATATGKVVSVDNAKSVYPNIKLTNISPYSYGSLRLIATGKNMLVNEAYSQLISGVGFTQNADRSITMSGTATATIEYNLGGSSLNTRPILVLKKGLNYYLSSNNFTITMYSYDGTDRTQIYSGTGGAITFSDSDKKITQIVISIASGTTISGTIFPQLEYGSSATLYEEYKGKQLDIDFSEYIEEAIFPSELSVAHQALRSGVKKSGTTKALSEVTTSSIDLFPSDTLYPSGTAIEYIKVEDGIVYAIVNGALRIITQGNIGLFEGTNIVYSTEDNNIEMTYSTNVLNGTFSGDVYSQSTKIIGINGLLTNLDFDSSNVYWGADKIDGYWFLGYNYAEYSGRGAYANWLELDIQIPENFEVRNAYVTLYHIPVSWGSYRGYCRNVRLYNVNDPANLSVSGAYLSEFIATYNYSKTEISGAFGASGFTGNSSTGETKTSSNIASIFNSSGVYKLIIQSSDSVPTGVTMDNVNSTLGTKTGYMYATINIIGYLK